MKINESLARYIKLEKVKNCLRSKTFEETNKRLDLPLHTHKKNIPCIKLCSPSKSTDLEFRMPMGESWEGKLQRNAGNVDWKMATRQSTEWITAKSPVTCFLPCVFCFLLTYTESSLALWWHVTRTSQLSPFLMAAHEIASVKALQKQWKRN